MTGGVSQSPNIEILMDEMYTHALDLEGKQRRDWLDLRVQVADAVGQPDSVRLANLLMTVYLSDFQTDFREWLIDGVISLGVLRYLVHPGLPHHDTYPVFAADTERGCVLYTNRARLSVSYYITDLQNPGWYLLPGEYEWKQREES